MAEISLSVHGRSYPVACDDGQESHLLQLAEYIEGRMAELGSSIGQISEQRLLFMTCLLIADELYEARRQTGSAAGAAPAASRPAPPQPAADAGSQPGEEQASRALEACAQRIEAIAARLEGA